MAQEPEGPRRSWMRVIPWIIALAAVVMIAFAVPLRDRCTDATTHEVVRVERTADACVVFKGQGETSFPLAYCDTLRCEPGLFTTLRAAKPGVLVFLFAGYVLAVVVWSARWRCLLLLADIQLSLVTTCRVTVESVAAGILLPGGVGGDALRIASVVRRGAVVPVAAASVVLDRLLGLASMALAAVVLALPTATSELTPLLFVLGCIPVGLVVALGLLRSERFVKARWFERGALQRVVVPMIEYLRLPGALRALGAAFAVSLLGSPIQLGLIRGLIFAFGTQPTSEMWVYVGSTLAFIVSALPLLPGGWGTGDAAFVYFLGRAGVPAGVALSVVLVYRLYLYSVALGGAAFLARGNARLGRPV